MVECASPRAASYRRLSIYNFDGLRLSLVDQGPRNGRKLLFVHGTGMRARSWRHVSELLARSGHRCLALDLRGHGQSDWSTTAEYSLEAHASDLDDVVRHLRLSDYVVIGMSMGAAVSLAYAGTRPVGLAGLVLVDAGPMRSRAAGRERLRQEVFRVIPRNAYDCRARWWTESADVTASEVKRRVDQRVAMLWSSAAHVAVPSLVVRGAESDMFGPQDARDTADALYCPRLIEIPGSGHFVHRDQPAALAHAVAAFVRELDGGQ